MRKRRFVIRTIKDGQVQINGRIYKPTSKWLEYDGRLDGQRWAFGLRWSGDKTLDFIYLWGSEESYLAAADERKWVVHCAVSTLSPDIVCDGRGFWHYPWATWHTEKT